MARFFAGGTTTDAININLGTGISILRSGAIWVYIFGYDTTTRRTHEWSSGTMPGPGIEILQMTSTPLFQVSIGWSITNASANLGAGQPSTNMWHHIAWTYDGNSTTNVPRIYVDGLFVTPAATVEGAGTLSQGTQNHTIGNRNPSPNRAFNGYLAEYARWNRILNDQEIFSMSRGYSASFFKNGLWLYFPLIGKNSPEPDIKGRKLGTLTGTVKHPHPKIIYPA